MTLEEINRNPMKFYSKFFPGKSEKEIEKLMKDNKIKAEDNKDPKDIILSQDEIDSLLTSISGDKEDKEDKEKSYEEMVAFMLISTMRDLLEVVFKQTTTEGFYKVSHALFNANEYYHELIIKKKLEAQKGEYSRE